MILACRVRGAGHAPVRVAVDEARVVLDSVALFFGQERVALVLALARLLVSHGGRDFLRHSARGVVFERALDDLGPQHLGPVVSRPLVALGVLGDDIDFLAREALTEQVGL